MNEHYQLDLFLQGLEELHIVLNEDQINQFLSYYELLIETNRVMNLTTVTDFDEVVVKHFLDSLSLVRVCDLNQNPAILDLGTGAGFPGIPIKIAFPDCRIVLLDSLQKRVRFLQQVIDELQLDEITAIHGRAEELGRNGSYRENFDLVVSRAVANLSSLSEYCLPFAKVGGMFLSYKSAEIDEEVAQASYAIKQIGGQLRDVYPFDLYGNKRSFVLIDKVAKTPRSYPRKAGVPSKNPLMRQPM